MDTMDMDTHTMDTMAERRGKLKLHLHLMLRPMLRQILTTTTMDTTPTTDMDIPISMAERRGKLRLSPKLKLIPKLIPGLDTMDFMVDTMDLDTMDMDTLIDTSI